MWNRSIPPNEKPRIGAGIDSRYSRHELDHPFRPDLTTNERTEWQSSVRQSIQLYHKRRKAERIVPVDLWTSEISESVGCQWYRTPSGSDEIALI